MTLPGAGETSTAVPSSAAVRSTVAGRHAGEAALCEPEDPDPQAPSTKASVPQARTATSSTMSPLRFIWTRDLNIALTRETHSPPEGFVGAGAKLGGSGVV